MYTPCIIESFIPDIEPGILRHRGIVECRFLDTTITKQTLKEMLITLSDKLGMKIHPELPEPIITSATGHSLAIHNGYEAMMFWLESGLHAYIWEDHQIFTMDMHSCKEIDRDIVISVLQLFLQINELIYNDIKPINIKQDSHKVAVQHHIKYGKGLFATQDIHIGEHIAGFYGDICKAEKASNLPAAHRNHAIQFSEHKRRDGKFDGLARYINHSCEPNCGLKGLFDLVAMQDIKAGEELTWNYAMTEDSDRSVPGGKCTCGSKSCHGHIPAYKELSTTEKAKHKEYTSDRLIKKYQATS